jgi:hypothetical protein
MVLLTSAFLPSFVGSNSHVNEIYAAVNMNLLNDFLAEVHILTESNCSQLKRTLSQHAIGMPNAFEIIRQIDAKLTCAMTEDRQQPTYADFFRYANETFSGRVVLFCNADVVFDDSLARIDPEPIKRQEHGYILSVQPPPHDASYKAVFNRECDNTPRCVVGKWQGGGWWGQTYAGCSWDGYVFSPPLSSSVDLKHVDIVMNLKGAENLAAYQLEVNAGLKLYNPCYHVHAYHWHCQGGKMHTQNNFVRADHPYWLMKHYGLPPHSPPDAVNDIFPCWNCPGIGMPNGTVGPAEYCQYGTTKTAQEVRALYANFRAQFTSPGICCKEPYSCYKLPIEWLPHCIKAEDVNCVTWDATGGHTIY